MTHSRIAYQAIAIAITTEKIKAMSDTAAPCMKAGARTRVSQSPPGQRSSAAMTGVYTAAGGLPNEFAGGRFDARASVSRSLYEGPLRECVERAF